MVTANFADNFGFIYIFNDVWYVNFGDRLAEQFRSTLCGSSASKRLLKYRLT